MKVLHVNDHYARAGGAETLLFATLRALEERGVVNVVVHEHAAAAGEDGRRAYRVPGLGGYERPAAPRAAEGVGEILRDERPDLVHIHHAGDPDVAEACSVHGPTVRSVLNHDIYCPGGAKYLPLLGRVCERPFGPGCLLSAFLTRCNSVRPRVLISSYRRSARLLGRGQGVLFLALSRYQAERLVENGCRPEAVRVLPPFTELPPEPAAREARPAGDALLFVGRVVPQKGLDRLLECLRRVPPPARLVVDGDGPHLERARALARTLALEGRVDFVGWAPPEEHLAWYRRASVVVVPSVWPEPFGMVGIEAMSFGKPVVAFAVGGIPEWLEDGVTGFLVRPYDVGEMAARIRWLLEDPDAARAMGRRGRERVERDFGKARYVSDLLRFYEEAIAARGGYRTSARRSRGESGRAA